MKLDTGGTYVRSANADTQRPATSANVALFDGNSTNLTSSVINVTVNKPMLLVAYSMPDGCEMVIEGVSVGSRAISTVNGCCDPSNENAATLIPSGAADILFRQPMALGGNVWKLTADQRHLLITLPGQYILQMNSTEFIGETHVDVMPILGMGNPIPESYIAGVQAGGVS